MSSFDVEVLPEAEAEAREAFRWYFDRSPMAADAFRVELFDAIDGLSETAKDWPEDEDGIRHYHLRHFPYTVMYEVRGETVTSSRFRISVGLQDIGKIAEVLRRTALDVGIHRRCRRPCGMTS